MVSCICFIVWNGIKYREEANMMMPFLACIINFAWEICAVLENRGYWGNSIWLALDIGIYILNIEVIWKRARNPVRYIALYLIVTVVCVLSGFAIFRFAYGMVYSSFIVNLLDSLIFVLFVKSISLRAKITVAVTKMIGTFCATLFYGQDSLFIAVTGSAIFLLDLFYLACCFEEKCAKAGRKGKKRV